MFRDGPSVVLAGRFGASDGLWAGRWPSCRVGWAPASSGPGGGGVVGGRGGLVGGGGSRRWVTGGVGASFLRAGVGRVCRGKGCFGWSAGRGQGPEAVECACDHLGPGPVPGEAEKTAAAGGDEVG